MLGSRGHVVVVAADSKSATGVSDRSRSYPGVIDMITATSARAFCTAATARRRVTTPDTFRDVLLTRK